MILKYINSSIFLLFMYVYSMSASAQIHTENSSSLKGIWACGIDQFEPNNQRAKAKNISTQFKHGREVEAHICRDDHDWFSFWLDKGQLVQITLDSTQAMHMPSIKVFAPRKRKSSGILRKSQHQQKLKIYAKSSGRYRIKVSSSEVFAERYILKLRSLK